MKLTRENFLEYTPKLKEVQVTELGGTVWIRSLTAAEQSKMVDIGNKFEKASGQDRMRNIVLRVIQWAVVDENGKPIFISDDIPAMMNKPAWIWMELQDEILAYSGMTKEAREELRKNLQSDPTESQDLNSPSFSAEPSTS